MMVDYSDWLNSLPREFHLNTGWFLVIAIVSVSVMFLILARCRDLTDSLGWEKCQACITSLIMPPVVPEKLRTLDRGRPWRDSQFASTRLSPSRDMSR